MGQGVGGGGGTIQTPTYKTKGEKLTKSIVIDEIKIVEETRIYPVPKVEFVPEKQIKYETTEEKQTKYVTHEEPTIKYTPKEESTIKYVPQEEKTIKYVPEEVKCEKPVCSDVPYERPVITNKEYTLVTFKDLEAIRQAMELMPQVIKNMNELVDKLTTIKNYKLVEQEIKVPKITWVPREEERIVWKDVERERPK